MIKKLCVVLAGCLAIAGCALQQQPVPPAGREAVAVDVWQPVALRVGRLHASGLGEASGLASSRSVAGVLWAINDSGNAPDLFALGSRGEDLGRVRVAGVSNVDWEDLATVKWQGRSYLIVADVGDNRAERAQIQLYVVPEPQPGGDGRFAGSVSPAWSIRAVFEDGPRDCEAVAVDEAGGQILLLSKRTATPALYRVPLRPASPQKVQVARRIAAIDNIPPPDAADLVQPFGAFRSWPTALDVAPGGRLMAVLTYKNAYLYLRRSAEPWSAALARAPQVLHLPSSALLPQREALCFVGEQALLVTSEGAGAPLFRFATARRP